jgi:2-keto-4-pentenoate hydratase
VYDDRDVNPRAQPPAASLDRGMRRQLEELPDIVGWKMGLTVPAVQEHLGLAGPVLGHLPRTAVIDGEEHSLVGGTSVAVEPELALEIGEGGGVGRMGLALEVVDLNRSLEEMEEVLAENVFQRAVLFGPLGEPVSDPQVVVAVNGEEREPVGALESPEQTLRFVHDFLARYERAPEPGQLVIAGSLAPAIAVSPGDVVALRAQDLGAVALRLT